MYARSLFCRQFKYAQFEFIETISQIYLVVRPMWTFALLILSAGLLAPQGVVEAHSKLAELPLDKLLNVKQALEDDIGRLLSRSKLDESFENLDPTEPAKGEAMPLKGDWPPRKRPNKLPSRRGDWDWDKGNKGKGDVSKIFETAVTVLAFLAFGGYLLCMIVMSARNNQGFSSTMGAAVPTAAPGVRLKRAAFLIEDSPTVDSLTDSLHRLAQGYAKYHQTSHSKTKYFTPE